MTILYIGNKLSKHGKTLTSIETLGPQLEALGYTVLYASHYKNVVLRLFDMICSIFINRKRVDKVLIDTYSKYAFWYAIISGWVCRRVAIPYCPILHGGNLPKRLQNNPKLCASYFGQSQVNIAPSNYLKHEFEIYGYNVVHIPNNIDLSLYRFKIRHSVSVKLLWVRSFDKIYNPLMSIDVLKQLVAQNTNACLCMVGPDKAGTMEVCRQYVSELGLDNNVVFTGKLSKQEWHGLSENYDIFINTTNVDNTPVSLIEALALGLPVVSTNVGGIPYLVDEGTEALLVPVRDVGEMSKAIISLVQNPSLAEQLSIDGRKKAELFDWEKVSGQWQKIL